MSQLTEIKEMIEILVKKEKFEELKTVQSMVNWREDWSRPFGELDEKREKQSINDLFYFLAGVMRGLGLNKSWNGK